MITSNISRGVFEDRQKNWKRLSILSLRNVKCTLHVVICWKCGRYSLSIPFDKEMGNVDDEGLFIDLLDI